MIGESGGLKLYCGENEDQRGGRLVWKGVYPKFTSDILPNRKDIRTQVRVGYII